MLSYFAEWGKRSDVHQSDTLPFFLRTDFFKIAYLLIGQV